MKFIYSSGDQPLEGYTIKRGIGRGGFGEVYYAVSDGGKEVALKLVQRHLDVELRGARHCLNLKHPNLVSLYDVVESEYSDNWVVMEYVGGDRLDEVIKKYPSGMPVDDVLRWIRGTCFATQYLHSNAIVHRDLKPGNVFMEDGVVKLGDYGLAKFITASRRSGQTESVGTVHYMAPEIAQGNYGKEIDVYALGIMLYEMLTGDVPFRGESAGEILMKHLTAQPTYDRIPAHFRPIVSRALHKDPTKRYQSVDAMLEEINGQAAPKHDYSAEPVSPLIAVKAEVIQLSSADGAQDELSLQFVKVVKRVNSAATNVSRARTLPSFIAGFVHLVFSMALLVLVLALMPLRIISYLFTGAQPARDHIARVANEAAQGIRQDPISPLLGFLRFLVAAMLSAGAGLVAGGVVAISGEIDAAIALGIGIGTLCFGFMNRMYFVQTNGRMGIIRTVGLALFTAIALGVGVGFFVASILLLATDHHDWRFYDRICAFSAGIGMVCCSGVLFGLLRRAVWALEDGVGKWGVIWRSMISLMVSVGVGFGTAAMVFLADGNEETAFMGGVAAGAICFGGLLRTMLFMVRAKLSVTVASFMALFSSLLVGVGLGLTVAMVIQITNNWHADEEAIIAGLGVGLLTCGFAGVLQVRKHQFFLHVAVKLLLGLMVSVGAGLVTGGIFVAITQPHEEIGIMIGVGTGMVMFATIASKLLLKRLEAARLGHEIG